MFIDAIPNPIDITTSQLSVSGRKILTPMDFNQWLRILVIVK
jgi:hypothetical protein